MRVTSPNEIAGANAGLRAGYAEKPHVILSLQPGVARLRRSPKMRAERAQLKSRKDDVMIAQVGDPPSVFAALRRDKAGLALG
jgi:hypothetical protein